MKEGPLQCRIAICGEAPGEHELRRRRPFVGPAGVQLDSQLREAQIDRSRMFITNVVLDRITKTFTEDDHKRVRGELAQCTANVIVALGEAALNALTGKKGISNYRGSILQGIEELRGRKIIPLFHPSYILHGMYEMRSITISDWAKVKIEARSSGKPSIYDNSWRVRRTYIIPETEEQLIEGLLACVDAEHIAFDIETNPGEGKILCISIAPEYHWALCVPLLGKPLKWLRHLRDFMVRTRPIKVAHHAMYDMAWLEYYGVPVHGLWMDTMLASHVLYPTLSHKLDFLTSLYTSDPFYKEDRKAWSARQDFQTLLEYCGKDSCVTWELARKLGEELKTENFEGFFYNHTMKMFWPYFYNMLEGVAVDVEKRKKASTEFQERIQQNIQALPFNPNSPKQVINHFKTRGVRISNAQEKTLKKAMAKYPQVANELQAVIAIKKSVKLRSTYLEAPLDPDNRFRTCWLLSGTYTGRSSSGSWPLGTGGNLQNVPPGLCREVIIPAPGKKFVQLDSNQAESRIVALVSDCKTMLDAYANGIDIHKLNASIIYNKPIEEITDAERQQGKRSVHGLNYREGPFMLALTAGITVARAKIVIQRYFEALPEIRLWHDATVRVVKETRTLRNFFGRRVIFYGYLDDRTLNKACAYVPQSTIGDNTHRAVSTLWGWNMPPGFRFVLQNHDSILVECFPNEVEVVASFTKEAMELPIQGSFYIPADVKVGKNWGRLEKLEVV